MIAVAKVNNMGIKRGWCYQVVEPQENDRPEDIRLVDDSGEDYLYPRDQFDVIEGDLE